MDFTFDDEALQPPLSYWAEDSTYTFGADMIDTTMNPLETDFDGWLASDLSLGFANPVEEVTLSEQFDLELFNTVPFDLGLTGGELLGSEFGRPHNSASALNSSHAIHPPLTLHRQAGIVLSDSNVAISSPAREQIG